MASLALVLSLACPKSAQKPEWAQTTPANCTLALSFKSHLLLKTREHFDLFDRYPMAAKVLDLFISKAKLDPDHEKSRITLYAFDLSKAATGAPPLPDDSFLLQIGMLSDPKAMLSAFGDLFPGEGHIRIGADEYPLLVIMDINTHHFRMFMDKSGRLWIGERAALEHLKKPMQSDDDFQKALEWVDSNACIQGFAAPDRILNQRSEERQILEKLDLPKGIRYMAWSLQTEGMPKDAYALQMAVTGDRKGIQQSEPWARRLAALISSTQQGNAPRPEIQEADQRLGLRAQVHQTQCQTIFKTLLKTSTPEPAKAPQ